MNKIQIGDPIPSFTLKDQNGNDFDISSFLGRKNLLYFSIPRMAALTAQEKPAIFVISPMYLMRQMQLLWA
jgi:hypothetical protein